MPGTVIGKYLNLGYEGNISRQKYYNIIQRPVSESSNPIQFGRPVVLNPDNTYSDLESVIAAGTTITADMIGGIAVRIVKQALSFFDSNTVYYYPKQTCDVMNEGQMTVRCSYGAPTAGGDVYIRVAANPAQPASFVGDFTAAADGANTVLIPNLKWMTEQLDANSIAELTTVRQLNA